MQSSGLKISRVPLFGWTPPLSGLSQWELQAPRPGEGCEGGWKLRKRRVFLPHIHSKPEQLKLAGLPFFAALLSSVHIALSQPLRQHGMYGEPQECPRELTCTTVLKITLYFMRFWAEVLFSECQDELIKNLGFFACFLKITCFITPLFLESCSFCVQLRTGGRMGRVTSETKCESDDHAVFLQCLF